MGISIFFLSFGIIVLVYCIATFKRKNFFTKFYNLDAYNQNIRIKNISMIFLALSFIGYAIVNLLFDVSIIYMMSIPIIFHIILYSLKRIYGYID